MEGQASRDQQHAAITTVGSHITQLDISTYVRGVFCQREEKVLPMQQTASRATGVTAGTSPVNATNDDAGPWMTVVPRLQHVQPLEMKVTDVPLSGKHTAACQQGPLHQVPERHGASSGGPEVERFLQVASDQRCSVSVPRRWERLETPPTGRRKTFATAFVTVTTPPH